jgi:hypothetical protein
MAYTHGPGFQSLFPHRAGIHTHTHTRRWCTEKSKERRKSEQQQEEQRAEARRTAEAAARLVAANAAAKAAKADAKAKRKEAARRRARDQANSEAATTTAAVVRLVYCPLYALFAVRSSLGEGERACVALFRCRPQQQRWCVTRARPSGRWWQARGCIRAKNDGR